MGKLNVPIFLPPKHKNRIQTKCSPRLPDLPESGINLDARQLLQSLQSAWLDAQGRQTPQARMYDTSSGHMRGLEEAIATVHLMILEQEEHFE